MPSNKNRLYIALYPTGVANNQERKYHWALLIGPKAEEGVVVRGARYHVKNSPQGWTFEETPVKDVRLTNNLLARVLIAKIEDEPRLVALLRRVPVIQGNPEWRCRSWVADAIIEIARDGKCVGTAQLDWPTIEAFAKKYVGDKTDHGRYANAEVLSGPRPTWDLLENKETIP